jgi:hypothetical protein
MNAKTEGRRTLRRGAMAAAAAVAVGLSTLVGASPAHASWYGATVGNSGVNVRDCYHPSKAPQPGTSCTYQTFLGSGTGVHIVCQHSGDNIGGDNVWDYVTYNGGEGYVADYYIYTGYSNWIPGVDVCNY